MRPQSLGGPNTPENSTAACRTCNAIKLRLRLQSGSIRHTRCPGVQKNRAELERLEVSRNVRQGDPLGE
ncbi:hypothetical protein [Mycobacterium uberis]|uniref:hypothetical protein n=1 Tax=Mycobacterium uberis TaxID=2162698 RepID=UPI000E3056E5